MSIGIRKEEKKKAIEGRSRNQRGNSIPMPETKKKRNLRAIEATNARQQKINCEKDSSGGGYRISIDGRRKIRVWKGSPGTCRRRRRKSIDRSIDRSNEQVDPPKKERRTHLFLVPLLSNLSLSPSGFF